MWAVKDPDEVRAAVAGLFTEDGEYTNLVRQVRGHDELVAQVAFAQEYYAERGSYTFVSAHDAEGLGDAMRFGWVLLHGVTGEAVSSGINFFQLAEDGRIRRAYQFTDRPPVF
jgi:hypothetical protein